MAANNPAGGQPAPIFYADGDAQATVRMIELLQRGGAYRYLWVKYPDGRRVTRWKKATEPVQLPPAVEADIYLGVHPCTAIPQTDDKGKPARPENVRGRNESIAAANCFYAEWDAKPQAGQDWTDAMCDVLDTVAALRYPPTVLICSGGGYQGYWMLPEPFIIRSDDDRQTLRSLQAAFVVMAGSDTGAKDIARVLRVPGTFNMKPERNRFVVRFVHPIIEDRFYSFDLMREWIESGRAGKADVISEAFNADATHDPQPVQISASATTTHDDDVLVNIPQAVPQPARVIDPQPVQIGQGGAMSDADLIEKIEHSRQGDKFKSLMAGSLAGFESHSHADESLCSMLAWWTKDDAQVLRIWSQSKLADRDKFGREDYQDRTIAAAREYVGSDGYKPQAAQPVQRVGQGRVQSVDRNALKARMTQAQGVQS